MKLVKGRPPNFKEIAKVLPLAFNDGVIFAYGDTIYSPSGKDVSHHLKVHEAIHSIRQKEIGVETWWKRYLEDRTFRYNEELIAHHAEYKSMIGSVSNRNMRRKALKVVSKKLASPLYGCNGGRLKATMDLKRTGK